MHPKPPICRLACVLMALVLLAACAEQVTPPPPPTPTPPLLNAEQQSHADEIDQIFIDLLESGQFSGMVLVEYQGVILLEKGYGFANRFGQTPNTAQTRFRLMQTSKPFTALGVMALYEAGKLDLQDPICNYIENCPADWNEIKIHNLLNQSSKLMDYTMVTDIKNRIDQPITKDDLLDLLRTVSRDPLYGGGDTDYVLLAVMIEKVSGQDYATFMTETIFKPLGLENTGIITGTGENDGLAVFYKGPDSTTQDYIIDASNYFGNGDVYSSAEDVYKFMQALETRSFLEPETIDLMFTTDEGYGYGWLMGEWWRALGPMKFGAFPVVGTNGTLFDAVFLSAPAAKMRVVCLANQYTNTLRKIVPVLYLLDSLSPGP